jgi:type I restriction-modification system DNA methylase subunit
VPPKPKNQATNSIQAQTKELWEAAVNLSGNIEPADHKHCVLPIIFLRFLSLRYKRGRAHYGEDKAQLKQESADTVRSIEARLSG